MPVSISMPAIAESVARAFVASPMFAEMVPGAMLALGIAMLLVILLRRSGRYYQKLKRKAKQAAKPTRRQEQTDNMFNRASPLLDAPSTIVRWQVEMQELARDLKAEIDTKMRLLQVLVQRSDEAAARLEAAAAHAQRLGCVDRPQGVDVDSIESLAEQAASTRSATPPPMPTFSAQVYSMADSGNNAAEIADHVGLPVGDVEFVLSLRPQAGESV